MSLQDMANGHLDVKALAEAANGDENTIVTTRTGNTYPSAERAINIMFQNGGLPAIPFKTKALMTASTLIDGKYAMVTDDTDTANNGLYVKTKGVWVKSDYDPINQSKNHTDAVKIEVEQRIDNKTKNLLDADVGDALFAKQDANGNIVEVTARDGSQYLTGLDGSVQDSIKDAKNEALKASAKINESNIDDIAIAFADSKESVIAYFKNNAHLFLTHLSDSVQNEIIANKAGLADLTTAVGMTEVATVKGLVKGDYTVDAATILSMKIPATNNMSFYKTDSPYHKNDDFVHPCVIELSEPMRGYSYLMCITPYRGRDPLVENPTIYGSNDQVNWTMLTGFTQPIANPPEIENPESGEHGWLSDNWWAYDPINKELYCCYRKGYYANYPNGYTNNDRMQLLYRKTTNGLTWSKPVMFTPETTAGNDGQVAPSLVYDKVNSRWVMTYLKRGDWNIYVRFNTELTPVGWSEPVEIGFNAFANANGIKGWHIETKFIGNKLFMLIGDSVNRRFYFAYAKDDTYLSWTFSANSVLPDTWTKGAYKGSFIEVPQADGTIKIRMYWTDTAIGKIYSNLSPLISII